MSKYRGLLPPVSPKHAYRFQNSSRERDFYAGEKVRQALRHSNAEIYHLLQELGLGMSLTPPQHLATLTIDLLMHAGALPHVDRWTSQTGTHEWRAERDKKRYANPILSRMVEDQ